MHLFRVFHLQRRPVPLHSSTFFKNLIFSFYESCRFYLFICFIAQCFCVEFRLDSLMICWFLRRSLVSSLATRGLQLAPVGCVKTYFWYLSLNKSEWCGELLLQISCNTCWFKSMWRLFGDCCKKYSSSKKRACIHHRFGRTGKLNSASFAQAGVLLWSSFQLPERKSNTISCLFFPLYLYILLFLSII